MYILYTSFRSAAPKLDVSREVTIYCRDLLTGENEKFLQQQRIVVLLKKYSENPLFQQLFETVFVEKGLHSYQAKLAHVLQSLLGVVCDQRLVDQHIHAIQKIINLKAAVHALLFIDSFDVCATLLVIVAISLRFT